MVTNNQKYSLQKRHKVHRKPSRLEYTAVVFGIAVLDVLLLKKFWKRIHWRPFLLTVLIAGISGISWGCFILQFDPVYPAWVFNPTAVLGIELFGQTGEDNAFYIACGVLILCVMLLLFKRRHRWDNEHFFVLVIQVGTAVFCYFWDIATLFICLWFIIPGIYFHLKAKRFDLRHFCLVNLFVLAFAGSWDIWYPQWHYVSELCGMRFHSVVFNSVGWVLGRIPIAILPFFSLGGAWYIYGLYYFIEDFPVKQKPIFFNNLHKN